MLIFDTLEYSEKLQSVGFTAAQARMQAETLRMILDENIATKQDIAAVQRDIQEMAGATEIHIKELEAASKQDIEAIRRDIKELASATELQIKELEANNKREIESIRRDIKELDTKFGQNLREMELRLKHELTLRLGGMLVVGIGVVATLVKLL